MPAKIARTEQTVRARLRTILIAIALLAVLLAIIPVSDLIRLIRATSVRIEGASVWVRIDKLPGGPFRIDSGEFVFVHDIYVQIPIVAIAILLDIVILPVVLVAHFRSRWRTRAEAPPDGPGPTLST